MKRSCLPACCISHALLLTQNMRLGTTLRAQPWILHLAVNLLICRGTYRSYEALQNKSRERGWGIEMCWAPFRLDFFLFLRGRVGLRTCFLNPHSLVLFCLKGRNVLCVIWSKSRCLRNFYSIWMTATINPIGSTVTIPITNILAYNICSSLLSPSTYVPCHSWCMTFLSRCSLTRIWEAMDLMLLPLLEC